MNTSAEETELELARSGDLHELASPPDRRIRFWHYLAGGAAVLFIAPAIVMLFFYWIPVMIAALPVFKPDRIPRGLRTHRHMTAQELRDWTHSPS